MSAGAVFASLDCFDCGARAGTVHTEWCPRNLDGTPVGERLRRMKSAKPFNGVKLTDQWLAQIEGEVLDEGDSDGFTETQRQVLRRHLHRSLYEAGDKRQGEYVPLDTVENGEPKEVQAATYFGGRVADGDAPFEEVPLGEITMEPGKRYRVRAVPMEAASGIDWEGEERQRKPDSRLTVIQAPYGFEDMDDEKVLQWLSSYDVVRGWNFTSRVRDRIRRIVQRLEESQTREAEEHYETERAQREKLVALSETVEALQGDVRRLGQHSDLLARRNKELQGKLEAAEQHVKILSDPHQGRGAPEKGDEDTRWGDVQSGLLQALVIERDEAERLLEALQHSVRMEIREALGRHGLW